MLYVGIDIAKRKHECFIINGQGEELTGFFTVQNSKEGFQELLRRIKVFEPHPSIENTQVGLEATGHYSDNMIGFLRKMDLPPVIMNPLAVNLYRKGQSLRKAKNDKIDARAITKLLLFGDFEPHLAPSYHIEELKEFTRYRHRVVKACSGFKVSYDRLITIVFPELESFVAEKLGVTVLKLLLEFPGADAIAGCHLTRLTNLAHEYSRGRFGKDWAYNLKELAKNSIGTSSRAKAFELRHVIRQIMSLSEEIKLLDTEIKALVIEADTSLLTIPGIGYKLAAVILAEIGDIRRFANPGKLQAFAGLDPTTYQSGQFTGKRNVMVKRGSTYLRWALLLAARLACQYDSTFAGYLERKVASGKHYNAAMGHVAKKLIRVIFKLMTTGEAYQATPA